MHSRCVVLSTDIAVYSYLSPKYILFYFVPVTGLEVLCQTRVYALTVWGRGWGELVKLLGPEDTGPDSGI